MNDGASARDAEELEAAGAPARAELPASTGVGAVHLTVADLERSLDYYGAAVGPGSGDPLGPLLARLRAALEAPVDPDVKPDPCGAS